MAPRYRRRACRILRKGGAAEILYKNSDARCSARKRGIRRHSAGLCVGQRNALRHRDEEARHE